MDQLDKLKTIEESIRRIFRAIGELQKAFPKKKFTLDGRLVGDIGEVIAELKYDIKLYQKQKPDHDAETTYDHTKVQIKATFKNSLTFKSKEGYYLGFKLKENGQHEIVFNGPSQVIFKNVKRKGIGEKQLSIPCSKLKELSDSVAEEKRVRPRET